MIASPASAAIIRDFESVPSGDTVVAGGVLSSTGSPGSPVQQFNNTAVNGFGSQDATTGAYNGSYKQWKQFGQRNGRLVLGLHSCLCV